MVCFNEIFYFFFNNYFGPYRIDSRPVSDRIGPNWGLFGLFQTESDHIGPNRTVSGWIGNQKKKKKFWPRMRVRPRLRPHGASMCIWLRCAGPIGATVLPRWTLILGFCLNLKLPKRVLLLQSLWLHHQSKSGVYGMSIFGLYKLVFHQKQMFQKVRILQISEFSMKTKHGSWLLIICILCLWYLSN